jgi:Golgi SNAP receptor complex protein 2
MKKQQRDEAERARQALLHRKFTPSTANVNGETQLQLDGALDFSERLDSAHSNIDNSLEQGRLTLLSLKSQGELLKTIRTKMITMGNFLGLSSTVIHSIERRTTSDWWLLFGGMIVTLVVMFVLYKWLV